MRLVIPRYGIRWRGGNNDRLSTLWRDVISPAGVARSFSSGGGGGDVEQMRMRAEMNKPAEPQPVNPRDVA
jgi:hypothetical protein